GARKYPLLQLPRVDGARLEHVAAVVRLDDDGRASPEALGDERRDVAEVHEGGDTHAAVRRRKPEVVGGVVRDCEGVKIYLADAELLARRNLNRAVAQDFGALPRLVGVARPLADVGVARRAGDVDGALQRLEQHAQA